MDLSVAAPGVYRKVKDLSGTVHAVSNSNSPP
jgi:hypothetical protein